MSREVYKGYTLEVEMLRVGTEWSARVRIYDGGGRLRKSFEALEEIVFSTESEARRLGSYLGRDWIDEHTPSRR